MKLSTRARYAIRMMLELAKQPSDTAVSLGDISQTTNISRRYLEQLATALKARGLVTARAGRDGGYALGRPPSEIDLGQIIQATIGPVNIVDCVMRPETCLKADMCECRDVYDLINRKIANVFDSISLSDLTHPEQLKRLIAELEPRTTAHAHHH